METPVGLSPASPAINTVEVAPRSMTTVFASESTVPEPSASEGVAGPAA
jgi:hypothetical protein